MMEQNNPSVYETDFIIWSPAIARDWTEYPRMSFQSSVLWLETQEAANVYSLLSGLCHDSLRNFKVSARPIVL